MANRPSRRIHAPGATLLFRIHFKDGSIEDVPAASADEARKSARPGEIDKVKIIREAFPSTPQREEAR